MISLSEVTRLEDDTRALREGVDTGVRALASSGSIGSTRVCNRFRPLASLARTHRDHKGAQDLADLIDAGSAA